MALYKTPEEIRILKQGGQILARVRDAVAAMARPGITTQELEDRARELIRKTGARPAFLGYRGSAADGPEYPAALCLSVNDRVVHCAPGGNVLNEGDIVSIDIGVEYKGLYTDSAVTVPVGEIGGEARKLLEFTKKALYAGIAQTRVGNTIGDVAHAIQSVGEKAGLGVIRELVGHGVGHAVHEKPDVPNYGKPGTLDKLKQGMVLAIEPMFTLGDGRVVFENDGWTVSTRDGSLAAHFEHTVAITEKGAEVLTGEI